MQMELLDVQLIKLAAGVVDKGANGLIVTTSAIDFRLQGLGPVNGAHRPGGTRRPREAAGDEEDDAADDNQDDDSAQGAVRAREGTGAAGGGGRGRGKYARGSDEGNVPPGRRKENSHPNQGKN